MAAEGAWVPGIVPMCRSGYSETGVGVSKINVSTIEPFDDPNETLQQQKKNKIKRNINVVAFIFHALITI